MADTHLQVNTDGTTTIRKTELWPSSKQFQQEILRKIFEQNNWKVSRIENINLNSATLLWHRSADEWYQGGHRRQRAQGLPRRFCR